MLLALRAVVFSLCLAGAALAQNVRGVTVAHLHRDDVGYGSKACRDQLRKLADMGVTWVAFNDFAYMKDVDKPGISFGGDRSLRADNLRQAIQHAHAVGLKVLLKPHIWSWSFTNGKWHGSIAMTREADWNQSFAGYGKYIQAQAAMASEENVEALSLGCELSGTTGREAQWRTLTADVRAIYSGTLTYAAHGQEFKEIRWWDAVDVIGVTAYFPLADPPAAGEPVTRIDEAAARAGWRRILEDLDAFSQQQGRPLCLLEVGYSQSNHAAIEPWSYEVHDPDPAYQAMLIRVALEEIAAAPHVVGTFLWKWFSADTWQQHERREPFAFQDNPLAIEAIESVWRER